MKQRLCSDTAVILLYKNASILQWHHHVKNDNLLNNSNMYILDKTLRFRNKFDQDLTTQGISFSNLRTNVKHETIWSPFGQGRHLLN